MDLNSRILSCLHRLGESKVKYQEGFVYMVGQGGSLPASFSWPVRVIMSKKPLITGLYLPEVSSIKT